MSDEYSFWRDALAGKRVVISTNDPQPGYYSMKSGRDGTKLPVAIWRKNGELVCRVGNEMRDPHDVWTWCAERPVTKEAAKQAFQTGSWPGDVPIGHNSGTLTLEEEIGDTAAQAIAWLSKTPIADKTTSDMAANWRAKLLDLSKKADKQREAEKAPHLAASREVDAKYKPWIERATDAANKLRDALTQWMRVEEARQQAEARKKFEAERAAAEAERKRIEDERARQMFDDPIAALTSPEPELPIVPTMPEPVKVQSGGQRGRKAGLRTITRYVVTDYALALEAVKDHEAVREAVEKVAAARAKAGVAVPGVERVDEKVAA